MRENGALVSEPVNMDKLYHETRALLGIELTPGQLEALKRYQAELIKWNERHNLTAIRDPEQIQIKHFLDSMSCMIAMRGSGMTSLIDIGSGAGFPGIPMKILCPTIRLALVESIGKKADFLRHMVHSLGLEDVSVHQTRAEILGQSTPQRERFDWAAARAVAKMSVLMEYLLPFVRIGGKALALKGESGPAEAQAAERSIRLLGGELSQIIPITLPGVNEERFLIVVNKTAATPQNFPRRVGLPGKRPL
jgi:16S rRNA (guanine527-N7)-methyltransferase